MLLLSSSSLSRLPCPTLQDPDGYRLPPHAVPRAFSRVRRSPGGGLCAAVRRREEHVRPRGAGAAEGALGAVLGRCSPLLPPIRSLWDRSSSCWRTRYPVVVDELRRVLSTPKILERSVVRWEKAVLVEQSRASKDQDRPANIHHKGSINCMMGSTRNVSFLQHHRRRGQRRTTNVGPKRPGGRPCPPRFLCRPDRRPSLTRIAAHTFLLLSSLLQRC